MTTQIFEPTHLSISSASLISIRVYRATERLERPSGSSWEAMMPVWGLRGVLHNRIPHRRQLLDVALAPKPSLIGDVYPLERCIGPLPVEIEYPLRFLCNKSMQYGREDRSLGPNPKRISKVAVSSTIQYRCRTSRACSQSFTLTCHWTGIARWLTKRKRRNRGR